MKPVRVRLTVPSSRCDLVPDFTVDQLLGGFDGLRDQFVQSRAVVHLPGAVEGQAAVHGHQPSRGRMEQIDDELSAWIERVPGSAENRELILLGGCMQE